MGKDFRVGMITGVVLAGAALVWVATRPSLSLRARAPQIVQPPTEARQTAQAPLPWENPADRDAEANRPQATAREPARPQDIVQQVQNSVPASPASAPVIAAAAAAANPNPVVASLETRPATGAVQQDLTIYETREPIKTTRFHIVRKGENLSSIAQQYYGSSNQWRKIVAANAKTIKDPAKITPGTKLIIPD